MKNLICFFVLFGSVSGFCTDLDTTINFKISYSEKIVSNELSADIFHDIVLTSDKDFFGKRQYKYRVRSQLILW